jgi:quercetin 2,3-dioxygenase
MINIRRANERGHADYGWLDTYHTFSFNTYHDPRFMGFRDLRVINEDTIAPGQGFGTHGHADMEIITYVTRGALAHRDSTGGEETLRPHEVQRMTAGTGIRHSEFNGSDTEETHLLQIWILPEKKNLAPGYEQTLFAPEEKKNKLRLVASLAGTDGSVKINQDVALYASLLDADQTVEQAIAPGRHAWLQVVAGKVELNELHLEAGDGAAVSDEEILRIRAVENSEFLLFDLS